MDPLGPAAARGRSPGWVAWYFEHAVVIGIALALILFAIVVVCVLVATGTNPFTDGASIPHLQSGRVVAALEWGGDAGECRGPARDSALGR